MSQGRIGISDFIASNFCANLTIGYLNTNGYYPPMTNAVIRENFVCQPEWLPSTNREVS